MDNYGVILSVVMATLFIQDLMSCDEFRPFWVSWSDGRIQVGSGLKAGANMLSSKEVPFLDPVTDIAFKTFKNRTGHVILQTSDKKWAVHLGMKEVNITENVIWKQTTSHLGACSISCYRDPVCVSFTFNKFQNLCQGHNVIYNDLDTVSHHRDVGSDYFVTS